MIKLCYYICHHFILLWLADDGHLTVAFSRYSDYMYTKNSLSALIDGVMQHSTLHLNLRHPHVDPVWKWAQEMKIAAVKARCGVLHCECGRTTLEIKREGIMFKQRDVLCRSRRHCWTDEVISFSCMICSPTDQANCIGGEEKDREKKEPSLPFFSIWLCDYSLWLVTIVMVQSQ